MSPTCPEFRRQVGGHGCRHDNQSSQRVLELHTVLQNPDCRTLNTHTHRDKWDGGALVKTATCRRAHSHLACWSGPSDEKWPH